MKYNVIGYFLSEGFRNVFKNKKSTFSCLGVMCATMLIFGLFFTIGKNINAWVQNLEQEQGMQVFMEYDATEEEISKLKEDLGIIEPSTCGDLTKWAQEGVLLLNSILTVEKDKAGSHSNLGWEFFTDSIIKKLNEKEEPVVFILWGAFARSKKFYITNPNHFIIESTHPSPFSARNGFFGSKPFSRANEFLKNKGITPIDWQL